MLSCPGLQIRSVAPVHLNLRFVHLAFKSIFSAVRATIFVGWILFINF
jgi:hypothetical protein